MTSLSERQKRGHSTLGEADEPVGLQKLMAHGTASDEQVVILLGLTKSQELGVAIYDGGDLHRFRVLGRDLVVRQLTNPKTNNLSPFHSIEIANYQMAIQTDGTTVTARFWWTGDYVEQLRAISQETQTDLHLLDLTFPASAVV